MTQEVSANESDFQILLQTLKRASGFRLYLVRCNSSRLRAEILSSLKAKLEPDGIFLYYHYLTNPVASLDDLLPPGVSIEEIKEKKSVLVVAGLENSFAVAGEPQEFLHRLNFSRDLLPKKIPVPLVIWLTQLAFDKILKDAHDLWSWRSGTFFFSTPPELLERQYEEIETIKPQPAPVTGISEKLFQRQLALLTDYLADIKLQPESEKTMVHKADLLEQMGKLHQAYAPSQTHTSQVSEYLKKALAFQLDAVKIKETLWEAPHFELARSYNNIASIYQELGQQEKALEFQLKAVNISEAVLDPNHPDLAASYHYLSLIYQVLGQFEKALAFQLKAIKILEVGLGANHPGLAASYSNFSSIYQSLGQMEKALEFQEKAVKIGETALDTNHPDLAVSYHNLSTIFRTFDNLERAHHFSIKAVHILKTIFPGGHPNLEIAERNLAEIEKRLSGKTGDQ